MWAVCGGKLKERCFDVKFESSFDVRLTSNFQEQHLNEIAWGWWIHLAQYEEQWRPHFNV